MVVMGQLTFKLYIYSSYHQHCAVPSPSLLSSSSFHDDDAINYLHHSFSFLTWKSHKVCSSWRIGRVRQIRVKSYSSRSAQFRWRRWWVSLQKECRPVPISYCTRERVRARRNMEHVRVDEWGREVLGLRWWMEGSQQALVLCSHTLGGRVRSYFFHLSIHSRLSILIKLHNMLMQTKMPERSLVAEIWPPP